MNAIDAGPDLPEDVRAEARKAASDAAFAWANADVVTTLNVGVVAADAAAKVAYAAGLAASSPSTPEGGGRDWSEGTIVAIWLPEIEDGDHPAVRRLVSDAMATAEDEGVDLAVRATVLDQPVHIVTSIAPASPQEGDGEDEPPAVPYAEYERLLWRAVEERDAAIEWADRLAYAVAPVERIGEHSSHNLPWRNALDILEARAAVPAPGEPLDREAARRVYRQGWDDALKEAARRLNEDAAERCFYTDGSPKPHDVSAHWLRDAASRIVRTPAPKDLTAALAPLLGVPGEGRDGD